MKNAFKYLKYLIPGISFALVLSGTFGLMSVLDGYGDAALALRYFIALLAVFSSAGLVLLAFGKLFKLDLSLSNLFFLMFLALACGGILVALSHAVKWAFRAKGYNFWDFPRNFAFPVALFLFIWLSRTSKKAVKKITAAAALSAFGFWLLISLQGQFSLGKAKSPNQVEGPNILLLSIESFRYDHLGKTSEGRILTPSLDHIAEQSVFFDRYYVQAPYTTSSLTTLMTGRYPFKHGARVFGQKPNPGERPFFEELEKKGYKVELDSSYFEELFSSWQRYSSRRNLAKDYFQNRLATIQYNIINPVLGEIFPGLFGSYCFGYTTSQFQAAALMRRIRMNRNQRWFFWTHFDANCHWPYGAPPQFIKPYQTGDKSFKPSISSKEIQDWNDHPENLNQSALRRIEAVYSAEVSCVDRQIGMVIRQLEILGLLENTIVFITADHGELLGENGFVGHGQDVKENLLHVPLLIYPGERADFPVGIRVGETVESIDLAPTILELCGIPVEKKNFDGESLLALLRDNDWKKLTAYAEVTSGDGKMFNAALKRGEFRLIWHSASNLFSLHHYREDPGETRSLIEEYPVISEELKQEILRLSGKEDFFGLIPERLEKMDPDMEERIRALGYIK